LSVVGRDYYGVFPLKGKLLNVREANHQQIMKNEEIQNIVKILGLTFNKVYNDVSSLRYGHLMIMTDQDHDGSHIKGLLINFIHHFWPSLLKIEGFLQQFITPIVKCQKGSREMTFFTIPEYQNWKDANHAGKGWNIKYYKGLGTSTAQEAKEYFSHLQTHEIDFKWDDNADNFIDMAFAKNELKIERCGY
jgi:DNA topoisomerase-2